MKKNPLRKKRSFTLLEVMIVITIIGVLTSVVGFNMKGSLDKSRAYKTEVTMTRVKDILDMEIATSGDSKYVKDNYREIIANCGILKNPSEFQKDGWGKELKITLSTEGEIQISSDNYNKYCKKHGRKQIDL